jgi:hypothetical protein
VKVNMISIIRDATGRLSVSFQTYFEDIPAKHFQRRPAKDDNSGNSTHNDEDTNVQLNLNSMKLLHTSLREAFTLAYLCHPGIWCKCIIIINNINNEGFYRTYNVKLDQVSHYPKFRITQPCEQEINELRQTRAQTVYGPYGIYLCNGDGRGRYLLLGDLGKHNLNDKTHNLQFISRPLCHFALISNSYIHLRYTYISGEAFRM